MNTTKGKKITVLQWRNKFSGETGYVGSVSVKKGYFTAAFSATEAKRYRSQSEINKDLEILARFGELEQNDFRAETLLVLK